MGILHAIIPMQKVNDYIFPFQPKEREIKSFEEAKEEFLTDYPIENPAYSEKSRIKAYRR